MSEASEQWLEISLAWVDEQLAEIAAKDEAAFSRFMTALGLNNEARGKQ